MNITSINLNWVIHRWCGTDEYIQLHSLVTRHQWIYYDGGQGADLTGGPIYSLVGGSGGNPRLTRGLYIRRLIDEYKSFTFFTTAYFGIWKMNINGIKIQLTCSWPATGLPAVLHPPPPHRRPPAPCHATPQEVAPVTVERPLCPTSKNIKHVK
jgi:hypothetical protein